MKAAASQPAKINVTLPAGGFVDIIHTTAGPGYPRLCNAAWQLVTPAPTGISQPGGAGTTICVTRAMLIDFVLQSPGYTFAGIAFRLVNGGGPGNGSDDMKKEHITIDATGMKLSIKDSWANHGKPSSNPWNWDFYIIVQNDSGNIGIIDPDIQNEE